MKRIKRLAMAAALVLVVSFAAFWGWGEMRLARPGPEATAALQSDRLVRVRQMDRWLEFRPAGGAPQLGVVFYPGANADARGYAPVLHRIAAAGYLVLDIEMPFNFAIFAPDRGLAAMDSYPQVEHWVIMGHSMGGAMAGQFAHDHPERLAGAIIWDSYPPRGRELTDTPLEVWHIHRALADGRPAEKFERNRARYPDHSVWVPIPGGNHMNFGSFEGGGYEEEWDARISRAEQHALVTQATLQALRSIGASALPPASDEAQGGSAKELPGPPGGAPGSLFADAEARKDLAEQLVAGELPGDLRQRVLHGQ